MIQYDPYKTSYGSLLNTVKVTKELQRYLITTPLYNLNYEFVTNDTISLVIITGCNQDEKDLPIWDMPLIIEDIKGNKHICIDLRKYLKPLSSQPLMLKDAFKDKAACMFMISSSIFMADIIANEFGEYRKYFNTISLAYGFLISYIVNNVITLNPLEKLNVEIMTSYLANLMLSPSSKDDEYIPSIVARLSSAKFSVISNKKYIEEIIKKYIPNKIISVTDVVNGIKLVLPDEKAALITDGIITSGLSNIWYGPGNNETLLISLECIGLWIGLIYSAMGDQTYKKTRLSTILDKYSRNLHSSDFVKSMDLIIESKTIK